MTLPTGPEIEGLYRSVVAMVDGFYRVVPPYPRLPESLVAADFAAHPAHREGRDRPRARSPL